MRRAGETAPGLHDVIAGNIRMLVDARSRFEQRKSLSQRIADVVSRFAGSMGFVVFHGVAFGGWIAANSRAIPGVEPWDPFPFVMLAMWASVEAIFLSTFVLISQNRMAELAERRAELDLQINLVAEHELTKVLGIVDAIAAKLDVRIPERREVDTFKEELLPDVVLDAIVAEPGKLAHPETAAPVGKEPDRPRSR